MALKPDANTTPVSSKRVGPQSALLHAIPNTSNVANKDPLNADTSIQIEPKPKLIAKRAATAAPPELPRMYGSASGFLNNTCINTPETANNPPTAKAVKTRGSLSSNITLLYSL